MPRLLVMDDDADIGIIIGDVATGCGYEVKVIQDSTEFIDTYEAFRPHVIVLDITMPKIDGIELLRSLADRKSPAHIVLFSGITAQLIELSSRLGKAYGLDIAGQLAKPVRVADLRARLSALIA
ncbi:response regulator [Dongia soli]|uniref:Response regulator n=1 Tax=Dongia soli TaxID=600628 RepID=A0ABU5EGK5_9PROT|nr:response regulator [Dongia soli]MDY0884615.1 response regulator [Dongia soli]